MTHAQRLQEIGKFTAGLVAADLLTGLLFLGAGALPQSILGVWITPQAAWFWVAFDVFVLLVLVHYSWNPKLLEPGASSKSLFFVIGVIMGAVAVVHFWRLVFGWSIVVDGWSVPLWISDVGVIVAGYISYASFHFAAKRGKKV